MPNSPNAVIAPIQDLVGEGWRVVVVPNEFDYYRHALIIPPSGVSCSEPGPTRIHATKIIEAQIRQAVGLLKRLPLPRELLQLQGITNSWVDYVRDHPERMAVNIPLSSREVTAMQARLNWISLIDDKWTRQVVAARGAGIKWLVIRDIDPLRQSRRTQIRIHQRGLNAILTALLVDPHKKNF